MQIHIDSLLIGKILKIMMNSQFGFIDSKRILKAIGWESKLSYKFFYINNSTNNLHIYIYGEISKSSLNYNLKSTLALKSFLPL